MAMAAPLVNALIVGAMIALGSGTNPHLNHRGITTAQSDVNRYFSEFILKGYGND
jgi:hypothetical protein